MTAREPMVSRRGVLAGLTATAALAAAGGWRGANRREPLIVSAVQPHAGGYAVVAVGLDGRLRWQQPLPARGHDVVGSPDRRHLAVFQRRPGRAVWLLDPATGAHRQTLDLPAHHQFNGHGVFTADGRQLLTTETAFDPDSGQPGGVIGRYDTHTGQRLGQWATGALDPHQCAWCGDDLVVAHGGYVEAPDGDTPKRLDPARPPELTWLHARSGQPRRRDRLADPALSIRHLDVAGRSVLVGFQHDAPEQAPDAPLMGQAGPGQSLTALDAPPDGWRRFNGYIGSVAVTDHHIVATSPRGATLGLWHGDGRFAQAIGAADVCGAATANGQWIASTGAGALAMGSGVLARLDMAFDNHLAVI